MTLEKLPIGDFLEPVSNWKQKDVSADDSFRYIDLSSVDQDTKEIRLNGEILVKDAPSRARQILKPDDILVSTVRPNLNGVAVVPEDCEGAIGSTGFCVLRPKPKKLCNRYLFHWVRSPQFVKDMTKKATGQSYPAVSDKIVKESLIPLPADLDEQKRIAAILDQADSLRRARRQAVEKLNSLSQSIFYELFGDPVANSKCWPDNRRLGEIANIVSGITKGRKLNGQTTREVPYLAVANVQDHYLSLDHVKIIDATDEEIKRYKLELNDLLLTEGGDPDKLGRGTVWKQEIAECIHQNHVFRVRVHDKSINPIYLNWLVGSKRGKNYFLRSAKQTTGIASINMTQLREFPLLIPPKNLQDKFEKMIISHSNILRRYEEAFTSAERLFVSLQQRAFRGEL